MSHATDSPGRRLETILGNIDESAPAGDTTADVGLNGRLQRIAQNLTTIDGRVDGIEASLTAMAASLSVLDDWDSTDSAKIVNTYVVKDVTLTLDTSAYANGDLLADTQAVDAAFRVADGTGVIEAIQFLDEDDNTLYSFVVYFLSGSGSMGSENSAPAPTDAVARTVCGFQAFATTDGVDLANSKLYYKGGLNIPIKAISGTDDLGLAVVIGTGTPTHTASGVTMRLWIRQN